mmetsp:Transcript_35223/g.82239  ORF Transcript_35223/g.82239 Transcript_35223/m.82239 type:complete len:123 (-) Transcript_35223:171-539(-)
MLRERGPALDVVDKSVAESEAQPHLASRAAGVEEQLVGQAGHVPVMQSDWEKHTFNLLGAMKTASGDALEAEGEAWVDGPDGPIKEKFPQKRKLAKEAPYSSPCTRQQRISAPLERVFPYWC